ncbi:hypothetical protein JCM33374_g5692 [Metschnikowia sp. JCM 33374]|nr:hypothetical protein JCM33374_g5692 [Metschnikowia sp. JCM 33374]
MLLVGTDFYPHHARKPLESGVFADGNEYILPSGKLILEFNEYLGSFERDLSNIFAKKDPSVAKDVKCGMEHIQPNVVGFKIQKNPPKLKSEHVLLKEEPQKIEIAKVPVSNAPQATVGRPIGLRRRPRMPGKQAGNQILGRESLAEKLDAKYLSITRISERIPPGSNKLSKRLRLETGLFMATEDSLMTREDSGRINLDPLPLSMNEAVHDNDTPYGEIDDNDGLNEILGFTQKYKFS